MESNSISSYFCNIENKNYEIQKTHFFSKAFFLAVLSVYGQNPFILKSGEPVTIACGNSEEEVVHTALNLLNRDVELFFLPA